MGGFPFAAMGYEVTEVLEDYFTLRNTPSGAPALKELLLSLESELHTPVHFAQLEDSDGFSHILVCCYVDYQKWVYDCEELMMMKVPAQFERVKDILSIQGGLKRIFAPHGHIFSYDSSGRTRV
ncbi:hypothetical protein Hypma_008206 [Hypsizygus marmoreus]|uniref:Uncharacterized protein n=1 Tax=Hypsizygus marmoreus TaxID=39966 RepID=A0A369JTX4_HYPMA|nr:hypothetical protein Hypma_008206 [Hypsizygus marmoreus]